MSALAHSASAWWTPLSSAGLGVAYVIVAGGGEVSVEGGEGGPRTLEGALRQAARLLAPTKPHTAQAVNDLAPLLPLALPLASVVLALPSPLPSLWV